MGACVLALNLALNLELNSAHQTHALRDLRLNQQLAAL
eukprot:CAMPEP_0119364088 /NCGR_PEP_ID=MMETSP1334-20130426/11008_1 /TAXON_ID=127549 /ORGANISM="Calcidiscus leptoporus, Strain RCC1130" /LENGTH=37 /DNA_ID= /DNA_START= /DNA_END= /DNA_ORIENTATION=